MKEIKFKFGIGDAVTINALQIPGKVIGLNVDCYTKKSICVEWSSASDIHHRWFQEKDLTASPAKKTKRGRPSGQRKPGSL